ncbi:heavy metal-responsive transcriptional regulator [Aquipuribacter hungaricus]|uniref:Heavy metal-responsive transcriptional regulator n=2 Tax=Aquipuribacter hungaricus TaxID=545624 RepID=A0ABV7WNK3_9MICO
MRIGQLAARAGTTSDVLRHYERAGLLPPPPRSVNGYRDYTDEDLQRVVFVRSAQAAGLTMREIRDVVSLRDRTGRHRGDMPSVLDQRAAELDRHIAELTALRDGYRQLLTAPHACTRKHPSGHGRIPERRRLSCPRRRGPTATAPALDAGCRLHPVRQRLGCWLRVAQGRVPLGGGPLGRVPPDEPGTPEGMPSPAS